MPRPTLLFLLSLVVAIAGGAALESASRVQAQARVPLLNEPSRMPAPAPAWHNTSWLNTDHPLTLSELRGRVVLLNFWVFTCWNCTNTVPSLVDFDHNTATGDSRSSASTRPSSLPTPASTTRATCERALRKYGIDYPNRAGQRFEDLGSLRHPVSGPASCSSTSRATSGTRATGSST